MAVAFALVVVAVPTARSEAKPERALLGAEAFPDLPGAGWWAVCKDPEWFRLVAVPKAKTHDALGAAGCPKPIFFVKGLAGATDQHRIPLPFEVGRGAERALVVGKEAYFVRGARPRGSCAAIEIATSKRTQVAWSPAPVEVEAGVRTCPEFCLNRVWAGDLDQDDRPDFLLRTAEGNDASRLRLYLSSLAKDGELVGEFAHAPGPKGCK